MRLTGHATKHSQYKETRDTQHHTNPFPGGLQNNQYSGEELTHYAGFINGQRMMKNSGPGGK